MQSPLVMKTSGVVLLTSFASVLAIAVTVGCAAPAPQDETNDDNNQTSAPAKKATTMPPSSSSSSPSSSPSPSSTGTSTTPAPTTTPPSDPPPSTSSCDDLAGCCPMLTDTYQQLACTGAVFAGNETACSASLIACEAAVGLGGSSGSSGASSSSSSGGSSSGGEGTACKTDFDCADYLFCENKVCTF